MLHDPNLGEDEARDESEQQAERESDLRKRPPLDPIDGTGCAGSTAPTIVVVGAFFFVLVHGAFTTILRILL